LDQARRQNRKHWCLTLSYIQRHRAGATRFANKSLCVTVYCTIAGNLCRYLFRLSKHREIDVAVWIFFKHGAAECISAHRTTTMTQGEVVAINAITRNYRRRSLHEFSPRGTLAQHPA